MGKRTRYSAEFKAKVALIGAFCRAYDVETAIAEFLPDVWAHSCHCRPIGA